VNFGNRESTNCQRPTRCYCACAIVFHCSDAVWQYVDSGFAEQYSDE
jgi:hypothetical protein